MGNPEFDIMIGNPPCRTALIFVGIQGSGQTSFYRSCVKPFACDWKHISMDLLHSRRKKEQEIRECIGRRLSFVIDNTNPTVAERRRYFDMLVGREYEKDGFNPVSGENTRAVRRELFADYNLPREANPLDFLKTR